MPAKSGQASGIENPGFKKPGYFEVIKMKITHIISTSLFILLLTAVGCTNRGTGKLPRQVTFHSAVEAPSGFDAWTFFWMAPHRSDPDSRMEAIVMQPDGKEYFRYAITGLRGGGGSVRSDFIKDWPGGDPATLAGGIVRFTLKVDRGGMNFYPDSSLYKFAFYTKSDSGGLGGIDWAKPFMYVPAIMELNK